MELEKLDNVLEALLFISGEGLKIEDIMEHLELQKKDCFLPIPLVKCCSMCYNTVWR